MFDPKSLIAETGFTPHWSENLSDQEYHGCKNIIGSSQLRKFIQSPKAFLYDLICEEKKTSDAYEFGKLCHLAILEEEKFLRNFRAEPTFMGVTKDGKPSARGADAKAKKDAWYASLLPHEVVCSDEDASKIIQIRKSIKEHPQGLDVLSGGKPEIAGFYVDEETGIKLKIKPDYMSLDGHKLVDLKTTQGSSLRDFGNSVFSFRYDFQLYMYAKGIEAITGKFPDLLIILAVEKLPPFECAIYYFLEEDLERAKSDYRKALNELRECIDKNEWPMRQREIERIQVPRWFK